LDFLVPWALLLPWDELLPPEALAPRPRFFTIPGPLSIRIEKHIDNQTLVFQDYRLTMTHENHPYDEYDCHEGETMGIGG